jgi:hypothetical protein
MNPSSFAGGLPGMPAFTFHLHSVRSSWPNERLRNGAQGKGRRRSAAHFAFFTISA